MKRFTLLFTGATLLAATASLQPALKSITADGILQHIKVLASDQFEGRAPASHGEELTVQYITEQFKKIGLAPGNPDGTYVQDVPMFGIQSVPTASFTAKGQAVPATWKKDFVAWSIKPVPEVKVDNSDIVFVGYGVVAPEYKWDDYKGMDVKGKTIVMLINDPAVPDPSDPSKLDAKMFKGKAMTYYGRWTYKYEIASEKGAAAAIIIHETGPAGYPFGVVVDSNSRENFDIQRADRNQGRVPVQSWMTYAKAKQLFAAAGQDLDALKKAAVKPDFHPVALQAKASFDLKNTVREVKSKNVVAKLPGSDAKLKDEYVVYTAHWDHLGKDPSLKGDQIFNGAIDNASGVASILEIAKAFKAATPAPKRSILFLAVTAEEKGLLGAKYYAENPLYPLKKTLADINIDGINQWGRTKDIVLVGLGNSTLDDITKQVADEQGGRSIAADPEPEKGFYYRSDHFEFAKQGVPALDTDAGVQFIGKPPAYAQQKRDEYTEKDYHQVSDQVKPDWDLSGAVEDAQLLFEIGYRVAQGNSYPAWKPGTEFKAKREASLAGK